ncbi:hypothetical protein [Prauserella muralis]|nr:hypothetical protein [Prauserella muralis]
MSSDAPTQLLPRLDDTQPIWPAFDPDDDPRLALLLRVLAGLRGLP